MDPNVVGKAHAPEHHPRDLENVVVWPETAVVSVNGVLSHPGAGGQPDLTARCSTRRSRSARASRRRLRTSTVERCRRRCLTAWRKPAMTEPAKATVAVPPKAHQKIQGHERAGRGVANPAALAWQPSEQTWLRVKSHLAEALGREYRPRRLRPAALSVCRTAPHIPGPRCRASSGGCGPAALSW
jgi:hypothetical protein